MSAPILLGTTLPDTAVWSDRVTVALGQNPSAFTGPGTNTYLLGSGPQRILLDPGEGRETYLPVLERAMELCGCEGFQEIVLTHGHPDHIGGVRSVLDRFGEMPVSKMPWLEMDSRAGVAMAPLADGSVVKTEGVTLRALHTPGHAPDHLCFLIEEEHALISGDNVLGVGTTVIPNQSGDLRAYMASLERLLAEAPTCIYPAHGPKIDDGVGKLREYIAHRHERERQILAELDGGPRTIGEIVAVVYVAYPKHLHPAAGQSVCQHLRKLEGEGRTRRADDAEPLTATWATA